MSNESPWTLAKALIQISSPDSASKPPRNDRTLFIRRNSPELSSELEFSENSGEELNSESYSRSSNVSKQNATPPLPSHINTNNNNNKTPPRRRKYSKTSWYNRTDPGRGRVRSHLKDKDSKKRRVSFFPSLKIQEYADKDPYMVPLDEPSIVPVHMQWKYNENPIATTIANNNPSSPNTSFSIRGSGSPNSPDGIRAGVSPEQPRASLNSFYAVDIGNSRVSNSSLEIPDFIKEQLMNIVKKGGAFPDSNKTVITEYAALITPKKLSPVKKKMVFPPNALDPIHPTLKPRRKKGEKIQLSLDQDEAVIPISSLKKWLSNHTNNDFIPASLSTWLQLYSTEVVEHVVKLIYDQSKKDKKGIAHATSREACLVMKKYLGLDDSVNIPNLISTHLPMELWFEYNENC